MSKNRSLRRACASVALENLEGRRLFAYATHILSPSSSASVVSINDAGGVAGQDFGHAVVWDYVEGDGPGDLGHYEDATDLGFDGIANDATDDFGFIVGIDFTDDQTRPFVRFADGTVDHAKLGDLTQGTFKDVNNRGLAVGSFFGVDGVGFYQYQDGPAVAFAVPDGYDRFIPTAINDDDQVFGNAIDSEGNAHACLYRFTTDNFKFIADIPGFDAVEATRGLSENGDVLVNAVKLDNEDVFTAFTVGNNGNGAPVRRTANDVYGELNDMNDALQFVGTEFGGRDSTGFVNFAGQTQQPTESLDRSGGFFLHDSAESINNNGWITGTGLIEEEGPYGAYVLQRYTPQTFSLSGQLFDDKNANGKKDSGEPASGSRTVFLDTDGDGKLDAGERSTTSNASGKYTFSGLAPGNYKVSRVFPSGYSLSNGGGKKYVSAAITNADKTGVDLGSRLTPGKITGLLFNDLNKNGKYDRGDTISGSRTVFLDTNGNKKLDAGEKSTTSNAQGVYTFSDLAPGNYKVTRVFPSGYTFSNNTIGYLTIKVEAGKTVDDVNLGSKRA